MTGLMQRLAIATLAGIQFGGKRDLYAVFGYKREPRFADYFTKYVRQDVASRIIDAPVMATWREPPLVEGSSGFNSKWESLVREHDIWNSLERVDRLAGIGEFGNILVGYDDGLDLAEPARPGSQILFMQPFSQSSVTITKFIKDQTNKRFGLPEIYQVSISDFTHASTSNVTRSTISGIRDKKLKVHYTRMLHVCDCQLENNIIGIPRLSKVFNLLDDLLKVTGGSAETFWLAGNRGMQADVDKDMVLDGDDAIALEEELEEYQHQLRRIIKTRGVKINTLGSDVPNPKGSFDMIMSLISGATGIPKRILLGAEAGQLASQQDRANWADRISERQIGLATHSILKPTLRMFMDVNLLPDELDTLEITWPETFKMTPLEQGEQMAQKGRAVSSLSKAAGQKPIITVEESREILGIEGPLPKELEEVDEGNEPEAIDPNAPVPTSNPPALSDDPNSRARDAA